MKKLIFIGHSDDTLEEETTGQYIDNCASLKPIQCIVNCGKNGKLMVVGQYTKASKNGCWLIGACPVNEDTEMPDWIITTKQSPTAYSPMLCIEIPDGEFSLKWFNNGEPVQ